MTYQCDVNMSNGYSVTLEFELHWTVSVVKERLEDESGIPSYEQMLVCGNSTLLNNDVLCDVCRNQDGPGDRISMLLVRLDVPRELTDAEARRVWEAFRIYSTDCGETVRCACVSNVLRFSDIPSRLDDVDMSLAEINEVSFLEVLRLAANERQSMSRNCCGLPEPELPSDDRWHGYRDSCNLSACAVCRNSVLGYEEQVALGTAWETANRVMMTKKKQMRSGACKISLISL
eukprot:TRINITY_DN16860_c0_g1_i1.p1 TRINITY_DN16860_c0_g1~~TRINITY_DN16860_c0_g1_i1.p1  ORF type:complete len:247 (+),score=28.08 TRINITY_DN16860_c0_g1_i1:47-742(+)